MAATASARTAQPILDTTQSTQITWWTIVLTGSYASGGDTLDLSAYPTQSAQIPVFVILTESPSASVAPSGYTLYYQPGTTPANGKIRITSTAGTEFTAGTYSAALLAANIVAEAVFPTGI
jgi:hypothetical protein